MIKFRIENYVIEHFETNDIIKNSQHKFLHHCFYLTILLKFLFTIYNERAVYMIYFNFQKAFDIVSYGGTTHVHTDTTNDKRHTYGFTGKVSAGRIEWIIKGEKSWLKDKMDY